MTLRENEGRQQTEMHQGRKAKDESRTKGRSRREESGSSRDPSGEREHFLLSLSLSSLRPFRSLSHQSGNRTKQDWPEKTHVRQRTLSEEGEREYNTSIVWLLWS